MYTQMYIYIYIYIYIPRARDFRAWTPASILSQRITATWYTLQYGYDTEAGRS